MFLKNIINNFFVLFFILIIFINPPHYFAHFLVDLKYKTYLFFFTFTLLYFFYKKVKIQFNQLVIIITICLYILFKYYVLETTHNISDLISLLILLLFNNLFPQLIKIKNKFYVCIHFYLFLILFSTFVSIMIFILDMKYLNIENNFITYRGELYFTYFGFILQRTDIFNITFIRFTSLYSEPIYLGIFSLIMYLNSQTHYMQNNSSQKKKIIRFSLIRLLLILQGIISNSYLFILSILIILLNFIIKKRKYLYIFLLITILIAWNLNLTVYSSLIIRIDQYINFFNFNFNTNLIYGLSNYNMTNFLQTSSGLLNIIICHGILGMIILLSTFWSLNLKYKFIFLLLLLFVPFQKLFIFILITLAINHLYTQNTNKHVSK